MNKVITGTCVCPGIVKGKIKFFKQGEVYNKTDIIVLENWLTHEVLKLKDVGALISTTGGITSHASIIARELNIPSLVNVDINEFKEGQEVIVDSAEERIELI